MTNCQASAQRFKSRFLTLRAKQTFTELKHFFIDIAIFHYFNSDCQFRMETDRSDYTIGRVLS